MKSALRAWTVTAAHLYQIDDQVPGTPLKGDAQKVRWNGVAYPATTRMRKMTASYWGITTTEQAQYESYHGKPSKAHLAALSRQFSQHALPGCEHEARTILENDAAMLDAVGFDHRHVWCLPQGNFNLQSSGEQHPAIVIRLELKSEQASVSIRFHRQNNSSLYWKANSLTVFGGPATEAIVHGGAPAMEHLLGLSDLSMPIRKVFNTPEGHAVFAAHKSRHLANPAHRKEGL